MMTIEEYILEYVNEGWLPENHAKLEDIKFIKFVSSASHVWSEWTVEDFSTEIHYTLRGEKGRIFLGESDVIEFLDKLFPSQEV